MFKYLHKLRVKYRKLYDVKLIENEIELEFQKVKSQMNLIFNRTEFHVLVEYLEAKIENARDELELKESVEARARLEVYRDLMQLFNGTKENIDLEDSSPSPL